MDISYSMTSHLTHFLEQVVSDVLLSQDLLSPLLIALEFELGLLRAQPLIASAWNTETVSAPAVTSLRKKRYPERRRHDEIN